MHAEVDIDYSVKAIDYDDFDSCPEDYQKYVIRILCMQAYAERHGASEMGYQLPQAPDYRATKGLAKIVYDESNHAYWLYNILEKLGVSEAQAMAIAEGREPGAASSTSMAGVIAVGDTQNTWLDLVLNNMLMDRAGGYMVKNFSESSFKPWSDICDKIYEEEQYHFQFGLLQFERYLKNHEDPNLKQKFNQWYVHALNFFGPPNNRSQQLLKDYGIKRQSNEQLRQAFKKDLEQLFKDKGWLDLINSNIDYNYPCKQLEGV